MYVFSHTSSILPSITAFFLSAASETESPRRNIAKAVRRVFYRILVFYVSSCSFSSTFRSKFMILIHFRTAPGYPHYWHARCLRRSRPRAPQVCWNGCPVSLRHCDHPCGNQRPSSFNQCLHIYFCLFGWQQFSLLLFSRTLRSCSPWTGTKIPCILHEERSSSICRFVLWDVLPFVLHECVERVQSRLRLVHKPFCNEWFYGLACH